MQAETDTDAGREGLELVAEYPSGVRVYEHDSGFVMVEKGRACLSLFHPTDPGRLVSVYTEVLTHLALLAPDAVGTAASIRGAASAPITREVAHLGGAGMTVARALAAQTGAPQWVCDIDAEVTPYLLDRYPSEHITLTTADALDHLDRAREHPVVLVDVCVEFAEESDVALIGGIIDGLYPDGQPLVPVVAVNVLEDVDLVPGAGDRVQEALAARGGTVIRWDHESLARQGRGNVILVSCADPLVAATLMNLSWPQWTPCHDEAAVLTAGAVSMTP